MGVDRPAVCQKCGDANARFIRDEAGMRVLCHCTRVVSEGAPRAAEAPTPAEAERAPFIVRITVHGRPLSVNRVYQPMGRGRTFITGAGKKWLAHVARCARVAMGGMPMMTGPVRMSVTFYFDRAIKGTDIPFQDRDGPLKPLQDALEGVVYENDKWVVGGPVEKLLDRQMPRVEVTVEEVR